MVIVYVVIGLSIVLSYNRGGNPLGFRLDAWMTILFGILLAAFIYIGMQYTRQGPVYHFPAASCPSCRRLIPADANLCPYCGHKLR